VYNLQTNFLHIQEKLSRKKNDKVSKSRKKN